MPRLEGAHDKLIGLEYVDVGAPTGQRVSVESREEAVRDSLEQLISLHVGLVECLTAAVEQLSAGTCNLEGTMLVTATDTVIVDNDRSVSAVSVLIETSHNW